MRSTAGYPSRQAIAMAHKDLIASLDLGCTFEEAHKFCWACGRSVRNPQRAHIKPASKEGANDPCNFFLLCSRCHKEQPDGAPFDVQINWLIHHEADITIAWREGSALFDKLKAIAKPRKAERLLEEWIESPTTEEVSQWVREAVQRTASCSPGTVDSNVKWRVIEAFLNWLDEKQAIGGNNPGDTVNADQAKEPKSKQGELFNEGSA